MRSYEEVKAEVDTIADGRGKPIDDGIKELVISLRMHGVHTKMSCEGHAHNPMPFPWVSILYEDLALGTLLVGRQNRPRRLNGSLNTNKWCIYPQGQFRIVPFDRARPLHDMQQDAVDFAEWIRRT